MCMVVCACIRFLVHFREPRLPSFVAVCQTGQEREETWLSGTIPREMPGSWELGKRVSWQETKHISIKNFIGIDIFMQRVRFWWTSISWEKNVPLESFQLVLVLRSWHLDLLFFIQLKNGFLFPQWSCTEVEYSLLYYWLSKIICPVTGNKPYFGCSLKPACFFAALPPFSAFHLHGSQHGVSAEEGLSGERASMYSEADCNIHLGTRTLHEFSRENSTSPPCSITKINT